MSGLPRITVIVPCWHAAATLPRLAASVLDGAPENLQLLLVDDGSPDGTGDVCDALAANDPRVQALHRPNGGAAAARNTGLDAAAGDWVLFADADDELLPGLWAALPPAFDSGAGIIMYGMDRASGPSPCPLAPGFYPSPADFGPALEPLLFESGYLATPCNKLYRRRLLEGVRFDEALKINEDVLFNLQVLRALPAFYCLERAFYHENNVTSGSLSRRLRGDLLDAEAATRPALDAFLCAAAVPDTERERMLCKSRVRAALNQYGLLTGCKGSMPFAERRALFARILADADARAALTAQLAADPHRLLALPYRLGAAARWPGLLAAYTQVKNRFL